MAFNFAFHLSESFNVNRHHARPQSPLPWDKGYYRADVQPVMLQDDSDSDDDDNGDGPTPLRQVGVTRVTAQVVTIGNHEESENDADDSGNGEPEQDESENEVENRQAGEDVKESSVEDDDEERLGDDTEDRNEA